MKQHIILTGFMGTGKTVLGRLLSKKLGRPFIDLDQVIEKQAGKTIHEIFTEEGEPAFRRLEKKVLQEALQAPPAVIATGGGAILDPENRRSMREKGLLIALTAPPEVIFERVKKDRSRPLLQVPDPLAEIQRLIEIRQPFYEETDYVFDSSQEGCEAAASEIAQLIKKESIGKTQDGT